MSRFVPKRFEQILSQMIARVVARTRLSDVADSSAVKHILAAAARSDDEQYFQMSLLKNLFSIDKAVGDDLDERAKEIQPGTVVRYRAVKSTGSVVFSRNTVVGTVIIPTGTRAKTVDGVTFVTTDSGTIGATSPEQISGHGAGRDSSPIPAVAEQGGSSGNVVSGTVIKFATKPSGVDEVTNTVSFTGGQDKETDDAFRARIKAFVAGLARCPALAIESNLAGLEDPSSGKTVRFVNVYENPLNRGNIVVYVDDGTGSAESTEAVTGEIVTASLNGPPAGSAVGGETRLFLENKPIKDSVPVVITSSSRGALTDGVEFTLDPASGLLVFDPPLTTAEVITAGYTRYTGLIEFVQKVVDGDPNDRSNYPGLRAGGILALVRTPQVLVQSVTMVLTIKDGYASSDVVTAVRNAVREHINSLGISGDVIRHELIRRIMSVPGVYDVVLVAPATNVAILDDQMARTTNLNITIS